MLKAPCHQETAGLSTGLFTALSTRRKQGPVIPQDHLCRVVAGGAGDAASGMGSGAAMVETSQRTAIIGVSKHWPRRKQLVQRQCTVENVAAKQAELPFEIER